MIKFAFKIIFLCILAAIVFVALSLYSGGDKFRWFGKKVEQQSEKVGEKADKFKEGSDKVIRGVEQATEKVKEIAGSKEGKNDGKSR
jgi:hypothetical protein